MSAEVDSSLSPDDLFLGCFGWPGPAETSDWAASAPSTRDLCGLVLRAAVDRLGCRLASAWSLDPVRRRLILTAEWGVPPGRVVRRTLDCATSLTGTAVERKIVTVHSDLTKPDEHGRVFSDPAVVAEFDLTRGMLSIPLLNTSNLNQVLAVVNLFPGPDSRLGEVSATAFRRGANFLAWRIETSLRERCELFAYRVGIELTSRGKRATAARLCNTLARIVQRAIACDYVHVYLERTDEKGNKGIALQADQEVGDPTPLPEAAAAAEQSWRCNREQLEADRPDRSSIMAVPMRDPHGHAKGVICCTNRPTADAADRPFMYDDAAMVEAMGGALAPHLAILLADQQRVASLNRLVHELRVPVVALRAVLERLQKECRNNEYVFQYQHFNEIDTYLNIMSRQFKELDVMRTIAPRVDVRARSARLVPAIFTPAKRYVAPLLNKRRFSANQVRLDGMDGVRLWVDVDLMTQVVFNLLENAIKYYDGPPENFHVDIVGRWNRQAGLVITFGDAGFGVPEGMEEQIFEYGFRSPTAHRYNVTGDGIGLWLAREIVRAHGGDLRLGRRANPTEFVLTLPAELESGPPASRDAQ
jgi:NtrC-family two-component system sensor histidine kinase KinB